MAGGDLEEAPILEAESDLNSCRSPPILGDWRGDVMAWMALLVQGVGVDQFRGDKLSNSWLKDPRRVGFREWHYIAGLALRAGTYPTREFLSRGRTKEGAACRHCAARMESCLHILGQCPGVQGSRIRRHNRMCDLLAIEAERAGWSVSREFRLIIPEGGLRIPDLVCTKEGRALVLNVTVRYEYAPDTLQAAAAKKVAYYKPFVSLVGRLVGASQVKVMGFPVGARGKWPSCNNRVLAELGVAAGRRAQFARLVSRRVLLYSLDVLRDFLSESV